MVLADQDDEWQDGRRHFRPETMAAIDALVDHEEMDPPTWRTVVSLRRDERICGIRPVGCTRAGDRGLLLASERPPIPQAPESGTAQERD